MASRRPSRGRALHEKLARDPESILDHVAALQKPGRRRVDPLPQWRYKVLMAGRRRAADKRKRAAWQRSRARQLARYHGRLFVWWRVLFAMEPGLWFGAKALMRATGQDVVQGRRVANTLLAKGLVETRPNPRWNGGPRRAVSAAYREPKDLFRLTRAGVAFQNSQEFLIRDARNAALD